MELGWERCQIQNADRNFKMYFLKCKHLQLFEECLESFTEGNLENWADSIDGVVALKTAETILI